MVGCGRDVPLEADRWFTSAVEAEDATAQPPAFTHNGRCTAIRNTPAPLPCLDCARFATVIVTRDVSASTWPPSSHSDDPNVLHFVGVGSWECEDGHQAIETLSRAVELESPHPSSVPVLAQILGLSNRTAEAQTLLDRFAVSDPASQLFPGPPPPALGRLRRALGCWTGSTRAPKVPTRG